MNQDKKQDTRSKKEQISLYLSSDVIEKLEDIKFYAQKQLPKEKRRRLGKSTLYEIILANIIEDHLKRGQNSLLSEMIINWQKN